MSELGNAVWQERVGRYWAILVFDQDAESPDAWDTLGTLVHWDNWAHGGPGQLVPEPSRDCREDEDGYVYEPDRLTWCDFVRAVDSDALLMLPVHYEDYGSNGGRFHTIDLDQAWDGATGAIYLTETDIRREWGLAPGAPITQDVVDMALRGLEGEIGQWDMYFSGDVYGALVVDEDGGYVEGSDAVWGIYDEYPYSYAKSEALNFAQEAEDRAREADEEDATHGAPMFVVG